MKKLSFASSVLATVLLVACDGDARPFEEAVEISRQNIVSLTVIPPESSVEDLVLNFGESVQFGVKGINTASQDVTLEGTDRDWKVTDSSKASIDEDGRLVALADGEVGVYIEIGGLSSDTFSLLVSDANLTGVSEIVGAELVERCIPENYQATGEYDDLTVRDLIGVEWRLADADEGFASIVSSPDINATLTGLNHSAPVTLTATMGDYSLSKTITISDSLTGIEITPGTATLDVGDTHDFVATGTYRGASVDDTDSEASRQIAITQSVDWQVDGGNSIASVSNAADLQGQVTAVAAGNASLSASCGDLAASAPAVITVTDSSDFDELSFSGGDDVITLDLNDDSGGVQLRVSSGSSFSAANLLDNDDLDWEFTRSDDDSRDAISLEDDGDDAGWIYPEYVGEGVVTVTHPDGASASVLVEVVDN